MRIDCRRVNIEAGKPVKWCSITKRDDMAQTKTGGTGDTGKWSDSVHFQDRAIGVSCWIERGVLEEGRARDDAKVWGPCSQRMQQPSTGMPTGTIASAIRVNKESDVQSIDDRDGEKEAVISTRQSEQTVALQRPRG